MQLINLTTYKRNGILKSQTIAISVDDLATPIRRNSDGKSYFLSISRLPYSEPNATDKTVYEVNQTLSGIKSMSSKLLLLTVTHVKGFVLATPEQMVFNSSDISGPFLTVVGGTTFSYCENGNPIPVEYKVSESVADIVLDSVSGQLNSELSPYAYTEDTQSITGTSMVLSQTPVFVYGVFVNGQRYELTTDYTISTDTITFGVALAADSVTVVYSYASVNGNYEEHSTVTGTTMTLNHTPNFIFGVYMNGQKLTNNVDYTVSGKVITFTTALVADSVIVDYISVPRIITEETNYVTGTSMVLSNAPEFIFGVFVGGLRYTVTTDYTVSGNTITFLAPLVNEAVTVNYIY